jgi:hypothetical protein
LRVFDFMLLIDLKTAIKKNALIKIESQCHADSKHIFRSKIVQVLSEKNVFKLDAAFAIFMFTARFLVYFDFMRYL